MFLLDSTSRVKQDVIELRQKVKLYQNPPLRKNQEIFFLSLFLFIENKLFIYFNNMFL